MMARTKVGAVKLYMWTCPTCQKHNLVDEPWAPEQACEQCKTEVLIGPLVGAKRLHLMQNGTTPAPDLEDFATAAMIDLGVKKSRQEHTMKVIMRAFQNALK